MSWSIVFVALCAPLLAVAIPPPPPQAKFCTTSDPEHAKCLAMKKNFLERQIYPGISCIRGLDKYECMQLIEEGRADLISLWSADTYVAGKYHNLVPLMLEKHNTEPGWPYAYYALAVIHTRDETIHSLEDLRGKRSCHTGVNRHVGWLYPSAQFVIRGLFNDSTSCLDNMGHMASFFNESCASNAHQTVFDPEGKYSNLCALCGGEGDKRCSADDPYASYTGALKCLVDNRGDVAFVKDTTFAELVKERPELETQKDDYRLLCLDGSRKTLDEYKTCNWGTIPERAVVTSPNLTPQKRETIRNMFFTAQENLTAFDLFDSASYDGKYLLFSDKTRSLIDVGDNDDYRKVLGDYVTIRERQFVCERPPARWCAISDAEVRKCWSMRDALASRFVKPDLYCEQSSTSGCANLIGEGRADLMSLDGGDIYTSGKRDGLQVLMSENAGLDDAEYVAVAVVKKNNTDITFTNLKGKKSCHTGIGKTAGWNVPIGTLISTGQLVNPDGPGCNIARAAGNFFNSSCVPGALNPSYNPNGANPESLCALCAGTGTDKCARNAAEPFYSYSGAFRCMATGVGDVAFVKHVTAIDNTDGHNQDEWAKDLKSEDFELLCKDGTRKPITEYATCNLARVPSHGVVTGASISSEDVQTYISLLSKGQYYYGDRNSTNFRMFVSIAGTKDLLFSDSTQSLKIVPVEQRGYRKYLGDMASMFDHLNEENCQPTTTAAPSTHAPSTATPSTHAST